VLGKEVPMREFKKLYRDDQDQKPRKGIDVSWFLAGLAPNREKAQHTKVYTKLQTHKFSILPLKKE